MSRVLVVDDEGPVRTRVSRSLARLPDVEVVEAGSIADAIDHAAVETIDAVVTGAELTDGTALQLFPHLERTSGRIPAVVLSADFEQWGPMPEALPVVARTVSPSVVCDLVGSLLGQSARALGVADYLQIAGLVCRSVQLEVMRGNEPIGLVVIRDGAPWTALDDGGSGLEALARLLAAKDVSCQCQHAVVCREPRTLHGTCADILADTEEILAAQRQGGPEEARTRTAPMICSLRTPAKGTIKLPVMPAQVDEPRDFEKIYEAAIDALLSKRYAEAYPLFLRAKAIRSTPTLEANLSRLRDLGFG